MLDREVESYNFPSMLPNDMAFSPSSWSTSSDDNMSPTTFSCPSTPFSARLTLDDACDPVPLAEVPSALKPEPSHRRTLYRIGSGERLHWSPELTTKFVEAVHALGGHERAKPKAILEHMNVPGLWRTQVASKLQKYRKRKLARMQNRSPDIPPPSPDGGTDASRSRLSGHE